MKHEDEVKTADILLLSNEVAEAVNAKAVDIAARYGVKCILNPAPARENRAGITDRIYLFTPNEHELLGIEDKKNAVVTLGKKGCLIKATGEVVPAVDRGKPIDTTGAGDTFNGVLAAMLASGEPLPRAARIANGVSSLGVTRKYAVSSIPTRDEIREIARQ